MAWGGGELTMERGPRRERRPSVFLILILTALAAGIIIAGYFYYRNYAKNYQIAVEYQLSAIADLKVGELAQWRKERWGDAAVFYGNTAFFALVRRYFEKPNDREASGQLRSWLRQCQEQLGYDRVFLLDAQGLPRVAVPDTPEPVSAHLLKDAPEIIRSGRVSFLDFHRDAPDQPVRLAILVPILGGGADRRGLGILVLRIDPRTYLYPLISRWPTPSRTAETLLVRREGNDALYLNELKFEKNTAFKLRIPLDKKEVPAVKAVLGQEGIVEGKDYRGVPVLAYLRAIPDSPWFLAALLDRAEIHASLRERFWLTIILLGALLLSASTAVGVIWRQQRLRLYRERYNGAESVRALSSRQEDILAAVPDIIMEVDNNKVYIWANPAGLEFFGEDVIGREASFYLVQPLFNGNIDMSYVESWQRRKDGQKRLLAWQCRVLKDERGNVRGALSSARDITERQLAEEDLKRALADLERSNKELEQFASVASHDLQEPLRMVASYTQLLAERYENRLDDKAKKYIDYAVDGAVRMQRLISDLLTYSRVGTRGNPLKPTDSRSALGQAIQNLAAMIEESGAIITNDELPTVRADASQLVQVFQNLIANAIKFRGKGIPRVQVSAQDHGREWAFSIQDNGIGIDPQYADRVFQIFQRLHTRQEYPGTGIGLAVCKRIVERHGGRIWFESEPEKGSTFFFTIPK
jgi:PAS domain S-box-containing protein